MADSAESPKFRPGPVGYWKQALATTINAVGYALTGGRYLLLEGRVSRGIWRNWTRGEARVAPEEGHPETEAAIVALIRGSNRVRVVGSGHSFNAGVRGEGFLSLDRYAGIIDDYEHPAEVTSLAAERGGTVVRVRAGTRVRDLNRSLRRRNLAIAALPSHDAQSIAGILSTDVHGTGREIGFVSTSVVGLRIVDGTGVASDVWTGDPQFRAAIGGIGAVGVIVEVSLVCVPAFRVRQRTTHLPLEELRQTLEPVLATHDHASIYVFPFANIAQLHTWDRTDAKLSVFGRLREFVTITMAALSAAWFGDCMAATRLLPKVADFSLRTQRNTDLVMDSARAFNRTIYHMHQELEFAVPADRTWEVTDRVVDIYEEMFADSRMPFTLIELRFTPAYGTESLVSPGSGGVPHVYVNVVCNQSGAFEDYYARVEEYMVTVGAKPHLGKFCEQVTAGDMARLHGEAFDEFVRLRRRHDPDGRFRNQFTDRVFGDGENSRYEPDAEL